MRKQENHARRRRPSPQADPLQKAIDRTVKHIGRMTPKELNQSLIDAGILNRKGELAGPLPLRKASSGRGCPSRTNNWDGASVHVVRGEGSEKAGFDPQEM